MFVISWRNPTREQCHWGMDQYVEAAAAAVKMSGKAQRERAVRDADTHRQLTD